MQYGLIGEKLSHSFSKEIHESIADYKYELCEIPRDELALFLKKREFCAINITIPYKKEVIPYLDEISHAARELQAVNCIVNRDGLLYGYNTDYFGMLDTIKRANINISNKKILILGTGSTARTSHLVCKDLSAKDITFVSREKKDNAITYDEAYSLHNHAEIIINATPVGMYPNPHTSPLNLSNFSKLEAVFDAVYNPIRTQIVLDAQKRGIHSEGGLYMLVSQAVHAIEIFLDKKLNKSTTDEIYQKTLKEKENIVLIGMPSSGKTTVGKLIAKDLGREIYDLDDEIEAHIGCTIAEFFKYHTEKDFRDIETKITKEISKKNGIVIATGGGCILREENVDALRRGGRLYFIDRDIENLTPTDSRPLATKMDAMKKLYESRYQLYLNASNVKIDGNLTPQDEANLIEKEFFK